MKIISLIIPFLLIFFNCHCQNLQWIENITYSTVQSTGGMAIDNIGNIYVGGTYSPAYHGSDPSGVYLNKYDPNGNILWADTCNGAIGCSGVTIDHNNNAYLLGQFCGIVNFGSYTLNNSNWQPELYLIKYSSSGLISWIKQIPFTTAKAIDYDNEGNLYLIGGSFITASYFISKYDTLGNNIWTTDLGTLKAEYLAWNSMDGYVVCKDWTQKKIKKIDSSGNILWSHNFPKDIINIATDKNSNCYVTGYFHGGATFGTTSLSGSGAGGYGAYICRLDSAGQYDLVISADDTGGYVLDVDSSGTIYTACPTKHEMTISKYDSFGNYQFIYSIPSIDTTHWYYPKQINLNTSGDIYISGHISSEGPIAFLAKISPSIATEIEETVNSSVLNVFPNPSKGTFLVSYFSNEKVELKLNVFTSNGEIVYAEVLPDFKGELNKTINLNNKPKGVYFIEIIADKKRSVKKIVLN